MIEDYDITKKPVKDLILWIKSYWKYADQGYFKIYKYAKCVNVEFHTAGWSANEELFNEYEKIKWIGLFWQKSVRGGHYYYKFPEFVWNHGLKDEKEEDN